MAFYVAISNNTNLARFHYLECSAERYVVQLINLLVIKTVITTNNKINNNK